MYILKEKMKKKMTYLFGNQSNEFENMLNLLQYIYFFLLVLKNIFYFY
jgi:hypothetical protein